MERSVTDRLAGHDKPASPLRRDGGDDQFRVISIDGAQAKERMSVGGKSAGKGRPQGVENLPHPNGDSGKSRDKAGAAVGVSGKSVDFATKVLKQGIPELAKAVDEGRMAISTAAILATLGQFADLSAALTSFNGDDQAAAISLGTYVVTRKGAVML